MMCLGELQYIRIPCKETGRIDSKSLRCKSFRYEHIPRFLSQVRETNCTSTDSASIETTCTETTSKPM